MSFDRERSIIAQNAGTTAANIAGTYDGTEPLEEYLAKFDAIRLHVFNGTLAYAGAESIVEKFEGGAANVIQASAPTATTGYARPSGGGGSDVGSIVLKSGKHAGKTIAQVADEDVSYIEWTARESKNTFLRDKASEFLRNAA